MSVRTWIVITGNPAIDSLIQMAKSLGGPVTALVAGPREVADVAAASGVDKVLWASVPQDTPVEAYAAGLAKIVATAGADVVFGTRRPGDRAVLGAIAVALQAPALTGVLRVSLDGDAPTVTRSAFGGIAEESVVLSGPAVLLAEGGAVPAAGDSVPVEEINPDAAGVKIVETRPSVAAQVDLGAATRIVSIGRGLKAKADLGLIEALAKAADAELSCSRPVAEGMEWLPKDRYVGISGQHVAPDLYLAVGISGQLQHMVGVRGAKTIVAINSDAEAPVFRDADYGIVGDLYEIVPALTQALAT
jgi:electron transfer flavoprotein alpha subunit